MEQLQKVFSYEGANVRTVLKGEEVWFVAKDVCDVLKHTNSRVALNRLDEDEKGVSKVYTPGGEQNLSVINEFGLYSLVLTSNLPEAKKFKRWITHEVIPSIRKTGSYTAKTMTPGEYALLQAQNMLQLERKMAEQDQRIGKVETELKNTAEIIGLNVVEWRKKVNAILNRIAKSNGGHERYKEIRNESYEILESRARCKLGIRVLNKQKEMSLNGVPKSKVNNVSKLDVIGEDQRLTEIYLAIVKEMAIQYRVDIQDLTEGSGRLEQKNMQSVQ